MVAVGLTRSTGLSVTPTIAPSWTHRGASPLASWPAVVGAAGGLMAAQFPGFETTPAVAVGMGAAVVAVLRLPLAAVVLATLFTANAGLGSAPLIIVGVVAYLTVQALAGPDDSGKPAEHDTGTVGKPEPVAIPSG